MPTLGKDRFVSGIFKRELKNRFLCEVAINNQDNICYVPSSCHLSNFLSLENKKVILIPTSSKNTRTQYSLLSESALPNGGFVRVGCTLLDNVDAFYEHDTADYTFRFSHYSTAVI